MSEVNSTNTVSVTSDNLVEFIMHSTGLTKNVVTKMINDAKAAEEDTAKVEVYNHLKWHMPSGVHAQEENFKSCTTEILKALCTELDIEYSEVEVIVGDGNSTGGTGTGTGSGTGTGDQNQSTGGTPSAGSGSNDSTNQGQSTGDNQDTNTGSGTGNTPDTTPGTDDTTQPGDDTPDSPTPETQTQN